MKDKLIAFMMYLGENQWDDSTYRINARGGQYKPKLGTDKKVWRELTDFAVECGFNAVQIPTLDGVKYKSHPEIAVEGAWELPELGYEIIPFCTTYVHKYNVKQTVKHVNENVPNESVKAILVSAMQHTVKLKKFLHFEALNMVKYARADLGNGKILGYRSESKYGKNMR